MTKKKKKRLGTPRRNEPTGVRQVRETWRERHSRATSCRDDLKRVITQLLRIWWETNRSTPLDHCKDLVRQHADVARHRLARCVAATIPITLTSCLWPAPRVENVDVHEGPGTLDISETQRPGATTLSSLSSLKWGTRLHKKKPESFTLSIKLRAHFTQTTSAGQLDLTPAGIIV